MSALADLLKSTPTKTASKSGGSALAQLASSPPKKTSGSPFNSNTPGHDEFIKQTDQRAPSTSLAKNFLPAMGSAFKTVGKTALELPKGLIQPYTKPSETERQIEQQMPNKGIGKVASAIAKPITRTFEPIVESLGTQIGTAIGSKGKDLPSPNDAFLAGGAFGIGAAGSFIGGEKAGAKVAESTKPKTLEAPKPELVKSPIVKSEIKAFQTPQNAPGEAIPLKVATDTPKSALSSLNESPKSKTLTYKPIEEKPLATPEIKTSKLAQGVESKAIQKKLADGFEGLPEYAKVNVKDQAKAATGLLKTNREQAINIAMGHEKPPEGILPESVFVAVEDHAIKTKDVALLRDLATSSSLTTEATGMGQRIRMLAERDPNSAVAAMKKVMKLREEAATKKYGSQGKVKITSEITAEVKKSLPKAKDWSSFLEEIKCR